MDIQEIKRRFELLKMANYERYCLLSELAKELKVRKTDLMQFVIDNPKLFRKGSVEKKGKNMGACLFDGYPEYTMCKCDTIDEARIKCKEHNNKENKPYISYHILVYGDEKFGGKTYRTE